MVTRKDTTTQEITIGATIIAAVLIISAMILMFGNPTGMFADHYVVVARLTHVKDLREGAPVRLAGIRIGKVKGIHLSDDSRDAKVECQIDTQYNLPTDSKAQIATAGLVGDSFLEIIRGAKDTMIPKMDAPGPENLIAGNQAFDITDILTQTKTIGEEISNLARNLNEIVGDQEVKADLKRTIARSSEIADGASRVVGRFDLMLNKVEAALDNVVEVTADVKESSANVKTSVADMRRTLDELFAGDRMANTIRSVLDKVDALAGTLERRGGDIDRTIANVADFSDTMADLGKKLDPDKIAKAVDDVTEVTGSARAVLAEIDPKAVGRAVTNVATSLESVSDLVVLIRRELVLALAINKAADRIVAQKFKEMQRNPETRGADAMLREFTRMFQEAAKRGYLDDPNYPDPGKRPYMHPY